MHDNQRKPNYRKLMIGALIAAAGLALCTGIVFAAIGVFRTLQESRGSFDTLQDALQESPKKAEEVSRPDPEVRQAILPAHQEVSQEVLMVGIVPSPRIVRLQDVGDSQQLSVQGYYSDDSVGELEADLEATFSYTSSDASVVEVGPDGVLTAMKKGVADIEISYGSFVATAPVFVWGIMRTVPPIDPKRLLEIDDDGSAIVLNRVMVELEPGYGSADAEQMASDINGAVVFEFQTFPGFLVEFDAHIEEDLSQALAVLRADRRVALAYPDIIMDATQSPPNIETLNDLHYPDNKSYLEAGMGQAWSLMNQVPSSSLDRVVIVMIDTDFVSRVPDPKTGFKFQRGPEQFSYLDTVLNSELNPTKIDIRSAPPYKAGAHGAAVASVMVATNNPPSKRPTNESFSGVVSSVNGIDYLLVVYVDPSKEEWKELKNRPTPTTFTASNVAAFLEDMKWHKEKIDVVNMSIRTTNPSLGGWKNVLKNLIKDMPHVTFVAAAGNDAKDAKEAFPASLSDDDDINNVITVGGVMNNAIPSVKATPLPAKPGKSNFEWWLNDLDCKLPDWKWLAWCNEKGSNYGDVVTLGAPADEVWVTDAGFKSWSTGYRKVQGTSFAAPMVSGTVALLKALNTDLEPSHIKNLLKDTGVASNNVCKNPSSSTVSS